MATVSHEAKLEIDVEEYVQKFRPELMEAALAWAKVPLCSRTPRI